MYNEKQKKKAKQKLWESAVFVLHLMTTYKPWKALV